MFVFYRRLLLFVGSDLIVAFAAINRSALSRLEWYFSFFPTLSTYRWIHLASRLISGATVAITRRLSCLTTLGTALRLIGIAFGLEEFLLSSRESELSPTISTLKYLILKSHWMTSSLKIVG